MKMFPVLGVDRRKHPACPVAVPWEWLENFRERIERNHCGQTLEGLAQRGGLSPVEMWCGATDVGLWDERVPPESWATEWLPRAIAAWDSAVTAA